MDYPMGKWRHREIYSTFYVRYFRKLLESKLEKSYQYLGRTSRSMTLKDSHPFFSYLREPKLPVNVIFILSKQYDEDKGTSNYIETRKVCLQEAHQQARAATKASKKRSIPIMTKEQEQLH